MSLKIKGKPVADAVADWVFVVQRDVVGWKAKPKMILF